MKRLYQFAALFMLLPVLFFLACSEDEETPEPQMATILFNPDIDPFEGEPGDTAATTVSISAPDGLNALVVNKTIGDAGTPVEYDRVNPANAGDIVLTYEFEYILLEAEVGQTVYFDFEVDHEGAETAPKTITVTTKSPTARSYTATLLYAPLADNTSETFFSSNTGLTYSNDDVLSSTEAISANIDFGYYYGANDMASLASPDSYPVLMADISNWTVKNTSQFLSTTLTATDFAELVTFEDIDDVFDGGTEEGAVITQLAEGDVLAFATDADKAGGSKKGVILVKTIEGTWNENDYIELDILIQERVTE